MNENKIYRMVFEEIKDSLDWADSCKDGTYSMYIDGVISLTNRMIQDLNKTTDECECYKYTE